MKKFRLTDDYILINKGKTRLYQIQALRNFNDIHEGDLGGFIEHEYNLSQEGNCWVCDSALVYGEARVYGDARVGGYAIVSDTAQIFEKAYVGGYTRVFDNAQICGTAHLGDNAFLGKDAYIPNSTRYSIVQNLDLTFTFYHTSYGTISVTQGYYYMSPQLVYEGGFKK